jgi:hypothetical protein
MRVCIAAFAVLGLSVLPIGNDGGPRIQTASFEVRAIDAVGEVDATQERLKDDAAMVLINVDDVRRINGEVELHLSIRMNPRFSPGPIRLIDKHGTTVVPTVKPIVMRPFFSIEAVLIHPNKEPIEVFSDVLVLPSDFFDPGSYSVRKLVRIGAIPEGYSVEFSIPDLGAVRRLALKDN